MPPGSAPSFSPPNPCCMAVPAAGETPADTFCRNPLNVFGPPGASALAADGVQRSTAAANNDAPAAHVARGCNEEEDDEDDEVAEPGGMAPSRLCIQRQLEHANFAFPPLGPPPPAAHFSLPDGFVQSTPGVPPSARIWAVATSIAALARAQTAQRHLAIERAALAASADPSAMQRPRAGLQGAAGLGAACQLAQPSPSDGAPGGDGGEEDNWAQGGEGAADAGKRRRNPPKWLVTEGHVARPQACRASPRSRAHARHCAPHSQTISPSNKCFSFGFSLTRVLCTFPSTYCRPPSARSPARSWTPRTWPNAKGAWLIWLRTRGSSASGQPPESALDSSGCGSDCRLVGRAGCLLGPARPTAGTGTAQGSMPRI